MVRMEDLAGKTVKIVLAGSDSITIEFEGRMYVIEPICECECWPHDNECIEESNEWLELSEVRWLGILGINDCEVVE